MQMDRLASILGKAGSGGESKSEGPDKASDGRLSSAEAILRAIRKDDAEALDVALSDHYEACQSDSDDEGSDDDPGDS